MFLVLIASALICNSVKSQNFEVPENYVLKVKEDYARYEKDIIACANWLENSPLDKEENKRIEANAFLLKWLSGSPTVNVNLDAGMIVKLFEKNPHLQFIFLAGWTRYSLMNNYSNDKQMGHLEGLKSVINVYKKGAGIKKSKDLEKLVKLYDEGKLENWVKENVK